MTAPGTHRVPTRDECYEIIARFKMLPNILEHSELVERVAAAIVDNLSSGVKVNGDLVSAASLLHDLTKTRSLETGEHHDVTGAEELRALHFHSIAEAVENHVFFKNFDPDGRLEEREIVYYADKRVTHNYMVSVEERITDLIQRYGSTQERIDLILANKELILSVERKIQRFMKTSLDDALAPVR